MEPGSQGDGQARGGRHGQPLPVPERMGAGIQALAQKSDHEQGGPGSLGPKEPT